MLHMQIDGTETGFAEAIKRCRSEKEYVFHYNNEESAFRAGMAGTLVGDFSLLKRMLEEQMRYCHVALVHEASMAGENTRLRLAFPDYLYGFVEDTFARAIHHKIEGCGYAYRECVLRRTINLREYDRLFRRVVQEEAEVAAQIAFDRLLTPVDLASVHQEAYGAYLRENEAAVLRFLLGDAYIGDHIEALSYLVDHECISRSAAEDAVMLCDASHTEAAAMLLRYVKRRWPKKVAGFSLDEW